MEEKTYHECKYDVRVNFGCLRVSVIDLRDRTVASDLKKELECLWKKLVELEDDCIALM